MDMLVMQSRPPVQKVERARYVLVWAAYLCYATLILIPVGAAISLYEWWRDRKAPLLPYQPRLLAMAHHRWLGRTFVIGVIAMMAAAGHFYYGVGIVTAMVVMVWFVHRIVSGVMALIKHEPPPLSELTPPRIVTSVKYKYE